MRVLVLNNMSPFVWGGAEELCVHLVRNLRLHGVEAESIQLPFAWNPPERLVDEMLIARSIRLDRVDRVIALKFPAYLVPWPNKVLWLLHQFRQAYDLFDSGHSDITATPAGDKIRNVIRSADQQAFTEASHIFTNSPVTTERLRRYNGFQSTVLPPPLNDPELFGGGESEGYVLAAGRVNGSKRQDLLIRALRHAKRVRLVVAGPPDTEADAVRLRQLAAAEGVADRVQFELRFLSRAELAGLVNGAAAVAYLPLDEDSVGYVTMEAFHAGKPVLTAADSGGVLQLVEQEQTGWVSAPEAEAIATGLRAAVADPARARKLGQAGQVRLADMRLTWPETVRCLLQ